MVQLRAADDRRRALVAPDGSVPRVATMLSQNGTYLTGIEPVSVDHPRKVAHCMRKLDWQIGRRKLCPRLCPNGCLPSTNTVTYGETPTDIVRGLSR